METEKQIVYLIGPYWTERLQDLASTEHNCFLCKAAIALSTVNLEKAKKEKIVPVCPHCSQIYAGVLKFNGEDVSHDGFLINGKIVNPTRV